MRLGKKSRFLLESNEMPNEDGLVATDFVRLFLFPMNKNDFFQAAVLLSRSVQDLTQIYGQSAVFGLFVRNQNAFYGQTDISR